MGKSKPLSQSPAAKIVGRDRDPYVQQREALIAQIGALQALLKAERLKSAKLEFQLQEARNGVQKAA